MNSFPFNPYRYTYLLASQSPRRKELMGTLALPFRVVKLKDTEECYPPHLVRHEIPMYLAKQKSEAYDLPLQPDEILITADTIVWSNARVLGKPHSREEAVQMLRWLSGQVHQVYTGVCIRRVWDSHTFYAESNVFFRTLQEDEIAFYVDTFKPYDKAGAYGIQEWIGAVAIERIEGSYFNVMGLPVQQLYVELKTLCEKTSF